MTESQTLEAGAQICVIKSPPGDLNAHKSLRTTTLWEADTRSHLYCLGTSLYITSGWRAVKNSFHSGKYYICISLIQGTLYLGLWWWELYRKVSSSWQVDLTCNKSRESYTLSSVTQFTSIHITWESSWQAISDSLIQRGIQDGTFPTSFQMMPKQLHWQPRLQH